MSELCKINNSDLLNFMHHIAVTFNDSETENDANRIEHFLQNGIDVPQWTVFMHGMVAGLQMKHHISLEEYLETEKMDKKIVRKLKLDKLNKLSK